MTKREISNLYLEYLENAEIDNAIGLFNTDGIADSPLYRIKKASDFYNELKLPLVKSIR